MLPKVIVHTMVSLDGRITTRPDAVCDWGSRVPALAARPYLYWELYGRLRGGEPYADLVGTQTMAVPVAMEWERLAREPHVPMPDGPEDYPAARVELVPDARGRLRWPPTMRHTNYSGDLVVLVTHRTPADYIAYLRAEGIPFIQAGEQQVDLRAALEQAHARYGVETVICQGGGGMNGSLLRAGVVAEVSAVLVPLVVGGEAPALFDGPAPASDADIVPLTPISQEDLGDGIWWLRYRI